MHVPAMNSNQSTKIKNLSSTIGGHDAFQYYNHSAKGEIVDFDLQGLPQNIDKIKIKEVAGVKHVISADISQDNLKGIATGDGRIKIRLNEGETVDQIRLNFLKEGYQVKSHDWDARKRPNVTGPQKDMDGAKFMNAKEKKAYEL